MTKRLTLCLSLLVILGACSKVDKEETNYKYDYTCNSCATEEQVFSTKEDYCSGLLDESRNNSCCRNLREQIHQQNCK